MSAVTFLLLTPLWLFLGALVYACVDGCRAAGAARRQTPPRADD